MAEHEVMQAALEERTAEVPDVAAAKPAVSSATADTSAADAVTLLRPAAIPAAKYPGLAATSSYRQLTTVGGCHQYTISGYALARALGPGTCLRSEPFTAGAQAFQLEVFPAGLAADCCQHLSLFLTTPGGAGSSADHILYELAVVDQTGRGRHLLRSSRPLREGPSLQLAQGGGVVAGYPCFVRSATLLKHAKRYLANDSLVIRATVEVPGSSVSGAAGAAGLAVPLVRHHPACVLYM
ncbi:hypothetical protein OEZ86_003521 [Tetradesmus obliquus]|nr:hypothetical protein OEZ86_003521 [Tetradesmus obliquus]